MSLPVDHLARNQALSPDKSFIVQAPAGSGKTELLIQRILRLLDTVEEPESVLAITFTKKAASEIRARVMSALSLARDGNEPAKEPDLTTYKLAVKVLERSEKLQWDIELNPNRLQLVTIDSLCSSIAKNAPVTNSFGAIPQITEDAEHLYRKAVKNTLFSLEDDESSLSSHLMKLYQYLDNHALIVEELLISMLYKRQQWLQAVIPMTTTDARRYLESVLETENETVVNRVLSIISDTDAIELKQLLQEIDETLNLYGYQTIYGDISNDDEFLRGVAHFLMTNSFGYRKSLTKNQGLLAASSGNTKDEKQSLKSLKEKAIDFVSRCKSCYGEELSLALKQFSCLPPKAYTDDQWDIMMSLIEVLKACVGNLKLVFAEQSQADFSEISQSALMALGMHENPSDLALSLDYRIQHILVDEFQDTSIIQYELLRLLTSGWEVDDGRTLFLVGDPMQAIYRFRDAEVANFIMARQNGISQVELQPLYLEQNFRSDELLVTSFNNVFKNVFAEKESLSKGEVSFFEASSFKENNDDTAFTVEALNDDHGRESENQRVVELVADSLDKDKDSSIAILARSRSHLSEIAQALKSADIHFNAVEMDSVASRPAVIDVLSLARAIYRQGDVTAWTAVLRQPFLGMSLIDIELTLRYANKTNLTILSALKSEACLNELSEEQRYRIAVFLERIEPIIASRHQCSVYRTVKSAAESLAFNAIDLYGQQMTDLEFTYQYLSEYGDADDLPSVEQLERGLRAKYATELPTRKSNVHLMTIHKSKGLQFDTVIIPGLDRSSGQPEQKLLNWHSMYSDSGEQSLLLAPLKSASEKSDPTYQYIEMLSSRLEREEMKRLMYVAMTRAKKRLHLISILSMTDEGAIKDPSSNTLLGVAWDGLKAYINIKDKEAKEASVLGPKINTFNAIKRPLIDCAQLSSFNLVDPLNPARGQHELETIDNMSARTIGDLLHLEMELLSLKGSEFLQTYNELDRKEYFQTYLLESGHFSYGVALSRAVRKVEKSIKKAIANNQIRKYLTNPLGCSYSEYDIQQATYDSVYSFRIDRLFEDDKEIVIVDYKSDGILSNESKESFCDRMKETYRSKMNQYRSLFKGSRKPVIAKLYLFEIDQFVEV